MARKFLTPIDLAGFELQNAKAHNFGSAPTGLVSGDKGLLYFNTATNRLYYWNGSAWELKASDSDLLQGQNGAYHLARANHSGTQLWSTLSDGPASVQAFRLDQFAAATSPITVPDGTLSTHAATKGQLDTAVASLTAGQTPKGAVEAVSTTNVNLASPGTTIDGLTAANGEIYLLAGQSTGTQNGPYVFNGSGSAMTRATNWDTNTEAVLGSYWVVKRGSKTDNFALLTNDTAITLGTTTPTFIYISAGGASYIGGAGLTLTGVTFDVGQGTGIVVGTDTVSIDTALVQRYIKGVIPTATTGIFTVSGAAVTINHALGNNAARPHVVYHTSPGGGNTQGDPIEVQYNNPDGNNTVLTFPGAPGSNQYYFALAG
jgi:hypothetical protein